MYNLRAKELKIVYKNILLKLKNFERT